MIVSLEPAENVVELKVKKREPLKDSFLVPVEPGKCNHWNGPFEVDVKAGKCVCKKCNTEVSPIFVLSELMNTESRWQRTRDAYLGEMKRLDERSSTKCTHCGKQTRISHY